MNIKLAASIVACAALFAGTVVAQERTESNSANVAAEKAKSDSASIKGRAKSSPVSGFGSGTGMGAGGGSGSSTSMSGGGFGSGSGSVSYTPGAPGSGSMLPPGTPAGSTGGTPTY